MQIWSNKRHKVWGGVLLLVCSVGVRVSADVATTTVTVLPPPECADLIDNDGDGDIDFPDDIGCASPTDDDESTTFACSDTLDNDGDGLVDFPADLGCDSLIDTDETDPEPVSPRRGSSQRIPRTFVVPTTDTLLVEGVAQPEAFVYILLDGRTVGVVRADASAQFKTTITSLVPGTYTLTFYSIDKSGVRSGLLSFPFEMIADTAGYVGNVFIPPTLSAREETTGWTVFGQTVPNAQATLDLFADGVGIETKKGATQTDGSYTFSIPYNTDSRSIEIKSSARTAGKMSPYGIALIVNRETVQDNEIMHADLNNDTAVDLYDFSMLVYWYQRENAPRRFDLNGDGKVTLADISIMMFYWTG